VQRWSQSYADVSAIRKHLGAIACCCLLSSARKTLQSHEMAVSTDDARLMFDVVVDVVACAFDAVVGCVRREAAPSGQMTMGQRMSTDGDGCQCASKWRRHLRNTARAPSRFANKEATTADCPCPVYPNLQQRPGGTRAMPVAVVRGCVSDSRTPWNYRMLLPLVICAQNTAIARRADTSSIWRPPGRACTVPCATGRSR